MNVRIEIPEWARKLASDHTDIDRAPRAVDSRKVSSFTLELPDDVYYEYGFIDAEGKLRADPTNPEPARNPWYPGLSAVYGPGYTASPYAELHEKEVQGSVERVRLESSLLGRVRRLSVYTPPGFGRDTDLPTVLAFDGIAFQRIAGLPQVLEALLGEGEVRPARLVFVEPEDRNGEYGFGAEYLRHLQDELLPHLEAQYGANGELHLMGASLGGLMSARLLLSAPERFAGIATFSGAFLGTPQQRDFYSSEESWLLDRLRSGEALPVRWHLQVGTIEWLHGVNRELKDLLEEKGYEYAYLERNAGHNWVNWRNGLAQAVQFLLAP